VLLLTNKALVVVLIKRNVIRRKSFVELLTLLISDNRLLKQKPGLLNDHIKGKTDEQNHRWAVIAHVERVGLAELFFQSVVGVDDVVLQDQSAAGLIFENLPIAELPARQKKAEVYQDFDNEI